MNILHIDSSPRPKSHSRELSAAIVKKLLQVAPDASIRQLAETLIREVEAADVIVIGTPMHNFTIPSVLKAWIDQVLRVGRTMESTPVGKVGMLPDRPVFIGVASGGVFTAARGNQPDFLALYLTLALNSIGLKTLQFLPLQATAFIEEGQASLASEKAIDGIDLTVVRELRDVAA
nr:NAD(P)H-dependent oxidoreductase [Bradyrhizobium zhanjiangense]